MNLLNYFQNNKVKLLKYLITIVVLFFLLCVIIEIFKVLFDDVYNTITLTYILLIITINFIPEFSPYILRNYLIYIFPFLSNYSGRGVVYILIGIATICPELDKILNFGGYVLIGTGLICLYMNWLLNKNVKNEGNEDIEKEEEYIKDNNNNINYNPKSEQNNTDFQFTDSVNNIYDQTQKDQPALNDMINIMKDTNIEKSQELKDNIKKVEMKELDS